MKSSALPSSEYAPFYAGYIACLGDSQLIQSLEETCNDTNAIMSALTEDKLLYRYASNKWSIKEILLHIIDAERVLAYRALRFARKDTTSLNGFDEDAYVLNSMADDRAIEDMIEELKSLRASTISMFRSFTDEILKATGTANENIFSVRALGFIIAGHTRHHLNVIEERYL